MKIGKKTAVSKEITRQERNRRNNIKRLTVSTVVSFILFILLIIIQSSILNQEQKIQVYQVVKDINSGTKLTEKNIDSLIALKEVQVSLIPKDYVTDKSILLNKFVNRTYKANDIITTDGVTDTENLYKDSIKNPTEISFSVESLSTAVAGIIREGDYVNIYGLTKYGESNYKVSKKYTFKHVYITKAFNGSGERITSDSVGSDDTLLSLEQQVSSTMFSIILDEKDVELFNEMLANCSIRLAKINYNTSDDYQQFLNQNNETAGESEVITDVEPSNTDPVDYDTEASQDTSKNDSNKTSEAEDLIDKATEAVNKDNQDNNDKDTKYWWDSVDYSNSSEGGDDKDITYWWENIQTPTDTEDTENNQD